MSNNHISQLPLELLWQVFDLLDHRQKHEAMVVCSQWFEILSTKKYLRNQVLNLSKFIGNGYHTDYAKHYPVVSIDLTVYKQYYYIYSLHDLRRELLPEELVQNVEELRVCTFDWYVAKLFGGKKMHFPNLRTLSFEALNCDFKDEIYAPNLESLRIVKGRTRSDGFQFVNQVKELHVASNDGLLFDGLSFPNLQRLTLDSQYDYGSLKIDFRSFAHQLTHLKVLECKRVIIEGLICWSSNLRVLDLTTSRLLDYDFIKYLLNLEELSVHSNYPEDFIYCGSNTTIPVPALKKAKVDTILASRLIAENLVVLHLSNKPDSPFQKKDLDRFFHVLRSRLQVYTLDSVAPSNYIYFIKHIEGLTNLQSLHLAIMDVTESDLSEVFELAEKRHFRFTFTRLYKEDYYDDCVDDYDAF